MNQLLISLCFIDFRRKNWQKQPSVPQPIEKMSQPIEKLNRVLKAMKGQRQTFGGPRPTPLKSSSEETKWKLAWMNVYDDLRKETAKLRSENERMRGWLDEQKATNKEKTNRNRLLQEKLKEQWDVCDKKRNKSDDSNKSWEILNHRRKLMIRGSDMPSSRRG